MPFTSLGVLIAAAAFIIGCVQLTFGLGIMSGLVTEPTPGLYLGNSTVAETVESGLVKILIAVAFGVLTEISHTLAK